MKQKNGYISVKYGPNVAKFELGLYLMMIHVYAEFHQNISSQTKVIGRKRNFVSDGRTESRTDRGNT